MNRDTVTGIVGAIVLMAAMAGVFLYERGQFQEYEAVWTEETGGGKVTGQALQQGDSRPHTLNITVGEHAVLSEVAITLIWKEDTGDEFEITVTPPDGDARTLKRTGGQVSLDFLVNEMPSIPAIADRGEESATTQAWSQVNETTRNAGIGDWSITVKLVNAPRPGAIPGVSDPVAGDNRYEIDHTYTQWKLSLEPRDR